MTKRVFLAINLPEEAKNTLGRVGEELSRRAQSRGIRWIPKENLHITLHFLGSKTEEEIAKLNTRARRVAREIEPFEIITTEVGCFPNERCARAIMVETVDRSSRAHTLAKKLGEAILELGVKIDMRPWYSHITLGRVKDGGGSCNLEITVPKLTIPIKSFELMESKLGQAGSQYSVISSYSLV